MSTMPTDPRQATTAVGGVVLAALRRRVTDPAEATERAPLGYPAPCAWAMARDLTRVPALLREMTPAEAREASRALGRMDRHGAQAWEDRLGPLHGRAAWQATPAWATLELAAWRCDRRGEAAG